MTCPSVMLLLLIRDSHLFWGDIHNHCNISYAVGSLHNALERAKQQLDFCSIIGHGFEPESDKNNKGEKRYIEINKIHAFGAKKLKKNWPKIQEYSKKYRAFPLP